jgi:hypothetical protein
LDEDGEAPVGPVAEDEPDELPDPLPPGVGEVEVGAHEAETLFTGPTPAGTIETGGVPGGTFTENVSVCPVSNVTVTLHSSAEAVGNAAIPRTANTDAADPAAILSLRLIDN